MTSAPSIAAEAARHERVLRLAKNGYNYAAGFAGYEIALTAAYSAAGFAPSWVVGAMLFFWCAVLVPIGWAHYSGFSRKLGDAGFFLPLQAVAISVSLALPIVAPMLAFQAFIALLSCQMSSFLEPNEKRTNVLFGLSILGAALVAFFAGPHFGMPSTTFAGRTITTVVVVGGLLRLVVVAAWTRNVRRSLVSVNRELKVALHTIEMLATRDDLTGLANRRCVMQWLSEQAALFSRARRPLSVALMDIDHFKRINDTFGHATGDAVLKVFAARAAEGMRATDRLGRYGGEEFLVVLPDARAHEAKASLDRMRTGVANAAWGAIHPGLCVTVTIGVAELRAGESVEHCLVRADAALYEGKRQGRNRTVIDREPANENDPLHQHVPHAKAAAASFN